MRYNIDTEIKVKYLDGQILLELRGQTIDLMKLDTAAEFRTVLWNLAVDALSTELMDSGSRTLATQPQGTPAESIIEQMERQADDARKRLEELANSYGTPATTTG